MVLLPGFGGAGVLDFLVFRFRCFLVLHLDLGLVVWLALSSRFGWCSCKFVVDGCGFCD